MFKNYLKIAFRNAIKYKAYSIINVTGLAVGIACCFVILLYVQDELSYDRFHGNIDQVYRVITKETSEGNVRRFATTFGPLAPAIISEFPEVKHVVRFFPKSVVIKLGADKIFQEDKFFFCDSSVFRVFSFAFLRGDPQNALIAPNSVVLTEEAAGRYFGDANPIGKILRIEDKFDYTVTGVIENVPHNSHISFDFLASISSVKYLMGDWVFTGERGSWFYPDMYTYILLPSGYQVESIENRFTHLIRKYIGDWAVPQREFQLQPLKKIHLHSALENELEANSNIAYTYILSMVALLVLIIACINFMNLSTALSANRVLEVGMRKVVGAAQPQLIMQFLAESLIYATFAMIFAVGLVELFLPEFNQLADKNINVEYSGNQALWLGMISVTVFIGIAAGGYPAIYLTKFRPIRALKGTILNENSQGRTSRLRSILVVMQFTISIVLVILTAGIDKQVQFLRNEKLGFNKEHVVIIPIQDASLQKNFDVFKNRLLSQSGIINVTAMSNFPWDQGFNDFPIRGEGMPEDTDWNMATLIVDHDFLNTFNMEIVEGRGFSKKIISDAEEAFILNETAVKKLGWDSALNKKFAVDKVASGDSRNGQIIGILKDFHFRSMHHEIEPLVLMISPETYYLDYAAVRISGKSLSDEMKHIENIWHQIIPHRPLNAFFLDEKFDLLYNKERKLGEIFRYFAGLTIFVACLGLFGMASFTAHKRTKEIGIRKVLGASIHGIVMLLAKDFTRLVVIAFVIASPVAYLLVNMWLQNFAYRTVPDIWIFLLSAAIVLGIALISVSWQSVRAAMVKPVESLRYE